MPEKTRNYSKAASDIKPTTIKTEPVDQWEDHTNGLCESDQEFMQDLASKYS